ncbi:HGxxPAAW family protein [Thermomonospora cellulosilytica]|uniref:Uncharacterized protein n=1 Tax=Thermomonospora cellulosilytica TaxID=1411118 RepID=A0A7W3N5F8_9ACTN|nr:HGxxPAAW family protein [Thermomonospora cellulosilytica]MBA9007879.1 hypothetical protein [Thermomonospora cellulosilytica]
MAGTHGGRPSSWAVVAVALVGFTVGGVALCIGPNWLLFWVGVAIVMLAGLLGIAVGIFSDVVLDEPRVIPEVVNYSLFGAQNGERRGGVHGEHSDHPRTSDPEQRPHG